MTMIADRGGFCDLGVQTSRFKDARTDDGRAKKSLVLRNRHGRLGGGEKWLAKRKKRMYRMCDRKRRDLYKRLSQIL